MKKYNGTRTTPLKTVNHCFKESGSIFFWDREWEKGKYLCCIYCLKSWQEHLRDDRKLRRDVDKDDQKC